MTSIWNHHPGTQWLLITVMLLLTLFPVHLWGQDVTRPLHPRERIPKEYASWSLFLICNKDWLKHESKEKMQAFHKEFRAFGRGIGADHVAVLFLNPSPLRDVMEVNGDLTEYVDINRHIAYCTKFKLRSTESPHVLVTTIYPDLPEAMTGNKVVLAFNELSTDDISYLLGKVVDQLLLEGLNQAALDSAAYWLAWQRSLETVYDTVSGLLKRVKLTIDTKLVKLEIGGEMK